MSQLYLPLNEEPSIGDTVNTELGKGIVIDVADPRPDYYRDRLVTTHKSRVKEEYLYFSDDDGNLIDGLVYHVALNSESHFWTDVVS